SRRSYTASAWPARIRQPAIGVPIVPVPTKPIRIVVLPATSLFDRVIHVSGVPPSTITLGTAILDRTAPDDKQSIRTAFRRASGRYYPGAQPNHGGSGPR